MLGGCNGVCCVTWHQSPIGRFCRLLILFFGPVSRLNNGFNRSIFQQQKWYGAAAAADVGRGGLTRYDGNLIYASK